MRRVISTAKSEFKNLSTSIFITVFMNQSGKITLEEMKIGSQSIINKFTHNHKVIIIGDASMALTLTNPGGSIEHWNKESGEFAKQIKSYFYKTVWLNPVHSDHWDYTSTIKMISAYLQKNVPINY